MMSGGTPSSARTLTLQAAPRAPRVGRGAGQPSSKRSAQDWPTTAMLAFEAGVRVPAAVPSRWKAFLHRRRCRKILRRTQPSVPRAPRLPGRGRVPNQRASRFVRVAQGWRVRGTTPARGCARGGRTSRYLQMAQTDCASTKKPSKSRDSALLPLSTPLPPPAIADPSYSGDRGSVVATAAATTAPGAPPRLRRPTRHPHVRSAAARAPGLYMAGALRHGQVPGPGRGWGRGQSWGLAYRVEREGQSAVVNVRRMLLR